MALLPIGQHDGTEFSIEVLGSARYLPKNSTGDINLINNEQMIQSMEIPGKGGDQLLDASWPKKYLGIQTRVGDLEWSDGQLRKKSKEEGGLWGIDYSCLALRDLVEKTQLDPKQVTHIIRYSANKEEMGNDKQKREFRRIPGFENTKIKDEVHGCSALIKAIDDASDLLEGAPRDSVVIACFDACMSAYGANRELQKKWRDGINRFPMALLFGDSGVAIAFKKAPPVDDLGDRKGNFISHWTYSVDREVDLINSVMGGSKNPPSQANAHEPTFEMVASNVKNLFGPTMSLGIKRNLEIAAGKIDYWCFHQANARALLDLCDAHGIDDKHTTIEAEKYGNAGAAAAPGVLHAALNRNKAKSQEKIGVVTMGEGEGGLCFAHALVHSL